jgi:RNA polymerase sigma-70 factor, ECF subfamily
MLEPHPESLGPETHATRSTEQAPPSPPDMLLIERARGRDPRACEAIMQRYNLRLFRIARSILPSAQAAADLVEDSYLIAFSDLEHYGPDGKLGAWLGRLAFTQAVSSRRKAVAPGSKPSALAAGPSSGPVVNGPPRVAGEAAALEESQGLERAIDGLPEVFRTVFVLRVVEGISGTETAACLGVHETTVRTRLYRAQRRLPAGIPARVSAERSTIFELNEAQGARIISGVFARLAG